MRPFCSSAAAAVATVATAAVAMIATSRTASAATANGCAMFDNSNNLYVFSATFGDYSLGPVGSFTKATNAITSLPGRPPFSTDNLICIYGSSQNSIYFLNADPGYNPAKNAWRAVALAGSGPATLANARAYMDTDTVVIYVYAEGHMWRLGSAPGGPDGNLADNSASLNWVAAENNKAPFDTTQYTKPTFGQAAYNMYFFGVPGLQSGNIIGYRIHYNEWGVGPQSVQGTFPNQHGQVAQFLVRVPGQEHDAEPPYLAYIPDDYSGLWIIDGYNNVTFTGPTPPFFTADTGVMRYLDASSIISGSGAGSSSWIDVPILSGASTIPPQTSTPTGTGSGSAGSSGGTTSRGSATVSTSTAGASSSSKSGAVANNGFASWSLAAGIASIFALALLL
ncbi:hypothetical protein DFJ73DRAFT_823141 [Zopfochytrium polystomum]|nr:hypothetical protein DFJ73DRAFT_823141 [Zopfochytrium polystomum]